jgi:hypothetical protein
VGSPHAGGHPSPLAAALLAGVAARLNIAGRSQTKSSPIVASSRLMRCKRCKPSGVSFLLSDPLHLRRHTLFRLSATVRVTQRKPEPQAGLRLAYAPAHSSAASRPRYLGRGRALDAPGPHSPPCADSLPSEPHSKKVKSSEICLSHNVSTCCAFCPR